MSQGNSLAYNIELELSTGTFVDLPSRVLIRQDAIADLFDRLP